MAIISDRSELSDIGALEPTTMSWISTAVTSSLVPSPFFSPDPF
jgi:hypothetical protein